MLGNNENRSRPMRPRKLGRIKEPQLTGRRREHPDGVLFTSPDDTATVSASF